MKIVVVSDSHGNRDILEKIALANPSATLFLHAGDSGLSRFEISPYLSVKGNCDYEDAFLKELTIQTPYGKLYITHGNQLSYINKERLDKLGAKIFIFGHTHMKKAEKIGDSFIFNPGSVTLPRDSQIGSYLVLDITNTEVKYQFIHLN